MPHRSSLAPLLALAALVGLVSACGGGAPTGDLDKLQVTLSQFEVFVTNTSGHTLTDVVAEIVPAGPASHFVTRPEKLENGESRHLAHTSFMDRDSLPFSRRNTKATRVTVTAKDVDGTILRVDVPFKS
ncbi:MAG TPA: hypothetical protein VK911_01950 [Vicinamibacterales bacterium]|nr:hypothetical protein [Vicinamibacterales bacterium]